MPHDRDGQLLNVGARVLVPAIVREIHTTEEYCNVSLETVELMYPGTQRSTLTLNARQVVLGDAPPAFINGGFVRVLVLVLLVILAALGLAVGARAQEPVPSPGAGAAWSASALGGAMRTNGGDFKPIVGARFVVRAALLAGFVVAARADATRDQDGGGGVDLADPNTFQAGEAYGVLYRDLWHGLGLAGIYGISAPFEGGRAVALDRYPQAMLGGIRYGSPGLTVYAGVGKYDQAGGGIKAFASVEVHTGGRSSTQVEVVTPGGAVRVFGIVKIR